MILLITYHLHDRDQRGGLLATDSLVERHAISSRKSGQAQWFIETDDEPVVWGARLATVATPDDDWSIYHVQHGHQGWPDETMVAWIDARLA